MLYERANREAIKKLQEAEVSLIGVSTGKEEIEFLSHGYAMLHSGPPVEYKDMCSAMKNAIHGAIVYEGWASNIKEAEKLAASGKIVFGSNNENQAVGPMAGIISPSMPICIYLNTTHNIKCFVPLNEGLGKTLRFGANDETVIKRLKWMERVLGPVMAEALKISGPIDLTKMLITALQRGDEGHNRNKAATSIFIRRIAASMVRTSFSKEDIADALDFLDSNDHMFLNMSMGVSKATMDSIVGISHCTIVACMCTNGHEFGIRVAGTGDRWFTAPSPYALGNYFPGNSVEDASPVLGDSYISEAAGIGGFAMACAPGISNFIGISIQDTIEYTSRMYNITVAEHEKFKVPALDYKGTPLGIDIRKVVATKILPVINTGIAHKLPGVGQVGAGIVYPPIECFTQATKAMKV